MEKQPINKFKAVILDTNEIVKQQAQYGGDIKMEKDVPKDMEKMKGFKKLFYKEFWTKLVWKHGIARDFYQNKRIRESVKEIVDKKNLFVVEDRDKTAHDKYINDLFEQFSSEYDKNVIHEEAGEKKRIIKESDANEKAIKTKIKELVLDYAKGNINAETLEAEEARIFRYLKENTDEKKIKKNEVLMHESNLRMIGEQIKIRAQHEGFLANEDYDIEVIYGKSMGNVRTEAHYNKREKLFKKILTSKVGQFTNDTTTVAFLSALSCITKIPIRMAVTLPGRVLPIIGAATIGSGIAYAREGVYQQDKRAKHFRDMAKNKEFDPNVMEARKELEDIRYETESAETILNQLGQMEVSLQNTNLPSNVLEASLARLAEIKARVNLSDKKKIDMVTYSNNTEVVKERMDIDIGLLKNQEEFRKYFDAGKFTNTNGQNFDTYLNSLIKTQENVLMTKEESGIDAKDRKFKKMKIGKQWRAAWRSLKWGIALGASFQELFALFGAGTEALGITENHRIGLGEAVFRQIKDGTALAGVGKEHLTALAYLELLAVGDTPKINFGNFNEILIDQNHIKIPEQMNLVENPDGTLKLSVGDKIIADYLTKNSDGTFTESSREILISKGINVETNLIEGTEETSIIIEDFLKNNPDGTTNIEHGRVWYGQNTEMLGKNPDGTWKVEINPETGKLWSGADFNEVRGYWAGENGTGILKNGGYELDVSRMLSNESFQDGLPKIDVQELLKAGKLHYMVSLSEGTQNNPFDVPIPTDGHIVINPEDPAVIGFGTDVNGHAELLARYGEVGYWMENSKGEKIWAVIATHEGKGLEETTDIIKTYTPETILTGISEVDTQILHTPVVPGEPLEKITEKKSEKSKQILTDNYLNTYPPKELQSDLIKPIEDNAGQEPLQKDEKPAEKENLNRVELEEYSNIKLDLEMINKAIQNSEGIVNLNESDFKSEYGRKRYNELKNISEGDKPISFNKTELEKIGVEMEKYLKENNPILVENKTEDIAKVFETEENKEDFISKEEVEKRAYFIYQERLKTGEIGDQNSDWFKAISEIKQERIQILKEELKKAEKDNDEKKVLEIEDKIRKIEKIDFI